MNWKLRIDYFSPLTQEDLVLFAPPAEVIRSAASYNAALQQYVLGEEEAAKKRLLQICADYPLFAQAGHLCGVLLAADGDFELAEDLLKRVRLLELSPEEMTQLDEELAALRIETDKLRRERAKMRRREALLEPVKAEIALRSILERAPDDPPGRMGGEDARERIYDGSKPRERRKTILTVIVSMCIALMVLLLFFWVIRPSLLESQRKNAENAMRVQWLEDELLERAAEQGDIAGLLSDYQNWLEAGKPSAATPDVSRVADESATP